MRTESHNPDQITLFGGMPPAPAKPTPIEQRREAMAAAYDAADDAWKEEYEAFILAYLAREPEATGEDIRLAYELTGKPMTQKSQRASGQIYKRLARERKIKRVGWRYSKLYGNNLAVYSLDRGDGRL